MANHGSATAREIPHSTRKTRTRTIVDALTRRAQSILNDQSVDPRSRAMIRYAMEINDPWLARLVRRADAIEAFVNNFDFEEAPETYDDDSLGEKIEALTEIICRAGDEPETKAAALLVLMATVEYSSHPQAVANMAKHFAFTRCGELNLNGMVDAQIVAVESELLT